MPDTSGAAEASGERWWAALPAAGDGPSVRWTSDAFAAQLGAWVTDALDGLEAGGLADLEPVHQRPWSTVWRATTTDANIFWVKENCPHQAFEAALLEVLSRRAPDRVVPVAAVDTARGLHLVPDQGEVLGASVDPHDIDTWCQVVAEAMHLQRELAGCEPELVAAGLTPLLPLDAADYVVARASQLSTLPEADPRRLDAEASLRVLSLAPRVAEWGEGLDALGLPLALVHNDLHAHNVFATASGMRFFDLGDAVLAHPLTAVFVPLNVLAHRLEASADDPRLRRVADAGLEVWSDVAPAAAMRAALPAAQRLGRLGRVESWLRVTATMTPAELAEHGDAAAWWLAAVGDATPLS
ncbi:phosphotransferase [Intrasporangium sp. YIM S08009]|uniref:phosphotransferase n=1 Tax=Intrasporangium zincisolvens TaxID=3080018 RepID=UPI002B054C37|nr:phosphotransferase [Intrasporangium sp. YIM S08009]